MEATKTCTKCGETKPATAEYFYRKSRGKLGLCAQCKSCAARYYQGKKDRYKACGDRWRNENRAAMRAHWRAWAARNKPKRNLKLAERRRIDPAFRVFTAVRDRLSRRLNTYKNPDRLTSSSLIGCSAGSLRAHFEANFLPGMTWDNYGKYTRSRRTWTADHHIPLRGRVGGELVFNYLDSAEMAVAASRFNLFPMWGVDNIVKSDRVPHWDTIPAQLQAICTPRIKSLLEKVKKEC